GYAGYIFNAEMHGAGLYTVRHRNYAPDLGRWINRDPAGYADGMNVYMYVRSMPLRAIDPTGLLAELLQVGATGDNGDGDGDGDGDEGGGDDDCDDKEKCPGGKLKTTQKVVIKGQVVAQNECELCC